MSKHTILITVILIVLAGSTVLLLVGCSIGNAPAKIQPKIYRSAVLITIDTLRGDHCGFTGNPNVRSPALDRLAKQSRLYPEAFTNIPVTLPAHAAMMTSRYPRETNVIRNSDLLVSEFITTAELLKKNGLATGAFPQAVLKFPRGLERGFDQYEGKVSDKRDTKKGKKAKLLSFQYTSESPADYNSSVSSALDWLKQKDAADQRYFLWVHLYEPHLPYNPPAPYRFIDQNYTHAEVNTSIAAFPPKNEITGSSLSSDEIAISKTMYQNEIFWTDQKLESLFRFIQTRAKQKPLLIVTADHGETLHDRFPYFGHAFNVNLEELHIPFMVHSDDGDARIIGDLPVQSVDVAPTILTALGIPLPQSFRGIDILHPASKAYIRNIPFSLGQPMRFYGAMNADFKVMYNIDEHRWQYWNRRYNPDELHPVNLDGHIPKPVRMLQRSAEAYAAIQPANASAANDAAVDPELMDMLQKLGYIQ